MEVDQDRDLRKLVALDHASSCTPPKPLYSWRSTHPEDAVALAMQAERQATKCRL